MQPSWRVRTSKTRTLLREHEPRLRSGLPLILASSDFIGATGAAGVPRALEHLPREKSARFLERVLLVTHEGER